MNILQRTGAILQEGSMDILIEKRVRVDYWDFSDIKKPSNNISKWPYYNRRTDSLNAAQLFYSFEW